MCVCTCIQTMKDIETCKLESLYFYLKETGGRVQFGVQREVWGSLQRQATHTLPPHVSEFMSASEGVASVRRVSVAPDWRAAAVPLQDPQPTAPHNPSHPTKQKLTVISTMGFFFIFQVFLTHAQCSWCGGHDSQCLVVGLTHSTASLTPP